MEQARTQGGYTRLVAGTQRHPLVAVATGSALGGCLYGAGMAWWLHESAVAGSVFGAVFAVLLFLVLAWITRRTGPPFPQDVAPEDYARIRRLVRRGEPVDDPELAPAVLHHARAVLRTPYLPWVTSVIFGLLAVGSAIELVAGVRAGDGQGILVGAVGVVLFIAFPGVLIPVARRQRRNARRAERQALVLLGRD